MNLIGQQLVDLANKSPLVRDYLSIPKGWQKIVKITNNSVHRLVGFDKDGGAIINANFVGTRKYKGEITTNQMIRLIESGAFRHLGKRFGMEDYYDAVYSYAPRVGKIKDYAKFAFDTTGNLNPSAGAASPADGYAYRIPDGALDWADVRGGIGTGDDSATAASDSVAQFSASGTVDQWGFMLRAIYMFDTSSMGAGATASAADFQYCSRSMEHRWI